MKTKFPMNGPNGGDQASNGTDPFIKKVITCPNALAQSGAGRSIRGRELYSPHHRTENEFGVRFTLGGTHGSSMLPTGNGGRLLRPPPFPCPPSKYQLHPVLDIDAYEIGPLHETTVAMLHVFRPLYSHSSVVTSTIGFCKLVLRA